jgi:hypothetical protein
MSTIVAMAFNGGRALASSTLVVGFQNPKAGGGGKGNTKTATRLLLDVLGRTEPVLQ